MTTRNGTTGEQPGQGPRLHGRYMPHADLVEYQRLQEQEAAIFDQLGRLMDEVATLREVVVSQAKERHLPGERRRADARAGQRLHRDTMAPDVE